MINEIDILHERHSCDFACRTGEEAAGLLCIISYHHEIVVELGEYCFDSFTESLVSPCWRTPVLLVQPIRDLKRDNCNLEEILLNLGTEITFVSKHHAVMIFPAYIIEILEVMDACSCHAVRMYNPSYSADSMEFITIIVQPLRGAISPVRGFVNIISPHGTTLCPCVLANLYGLGINAKHTLGAVNGGSHILANLFGKPGRQLTTGIELSAADQVWQILLALMVQTMKKEVFTVESESLGSYAESDDFEIRELRNNATSRYVSEFIDAISCEILADSEDSDEICYEVAHKQSNSSYSSLVATNLLIICELCNFSIYKYLEV